MEIPCSFASLQRKDFAASHATGKEDSKMSSYLLQDRVSVAISSGRLKGHINKLNLSDNFFSFK